VVYLLLFLVHLLLLPVDLLLLPVDLLLLMVHFMVLGAAVRGFTVATAIFLFPTTAHFFGGLGERRTPSNDGKSRRGGGDGEITA
jgi:carbon starvation protein CstA